MTLKETENQKKIALSEEDVSLYGYNFDELGKVFSFDGRIFRGIYPGKKNAIKKLLECGLLDELMDKGLFPKTTISSYQMEPFDLILEHEKITPVLYPKAWSFDMLKDAAKCVLDVNIIARKYGYQTMDSHGFNVLFKGIKPMFIDLGSFVPNNECPKGWMAYEQFVRFYYYPLQVFRSGNLYLARAVMTQGKNIMTHSSYYQYIYPLLRWVKAHWIDQLLTNYHKYIAFSQYSEQEIQRRAPAKLKPLLLFFKKRGNAPFQQINLHRLKRTIDRISLPKSQTQWGDYHDQFFENEGKISSTPRFNRIVEIIKTLKPESILEVGGNQGLFSQLILQETQIENITCSDYDEIAVNKMYNRFKQHHIPITPSLLDIVSPLVLSYGPSLRQRYESEMLIALALTHHLILTQKVPIANIFEQFSKFTTRYIITEFMPQGLFGPNAKHKYIAPEWYTLDWFKEAFESEYELLFMEQLETNRVVFVGQKKQPPQT
jgi:hypothetical protein